MKKGVKISQGKKREKSNQISDWSSYKNGTFSPSKPE